MSAYFIGGSSPPSLIAFLTEDELLGLHTWAGYTVLALIGVRLVWGLIGPRHARWSHFVRGPRATLAYLSEVLRGHPARYLGHNPAGAAMAVALIAGFAAHRRHRRGRARERVSSPDRWRP